MPKEERSAFTDVAWQLASRVWDEYEAEHASPPEIVYHYTDANGLLGILAARTVWATDARFFTDREDQACGERVFEYVLDEFVRSGVSDRTREALASISACIRRGPVATRPASRATVIC